MNQQHAHRDRSAAARRREEAEVRVGWKMAAIGMEVAAQVAGGALLGWAIDSIFGTTWGLLAGSITGLVVGLWTLVKGSLKLNKQLEAMGPRPRTFPPPDPQAPLTGEPTGTADAPADEDEMEIPSWREEWDQWKTGEDSDGDAGEQQD